LPCNRYQLLDVVRAFVPEKLMQHLALLKLDFNVNMLTHSIPKPFTSASEEFGGP